MRKPAPRLPSERKGDTRVREDFLVLPKTINRETRWLEYATWEEKLVTLDINLNDPYTPIRHTWKATRWLNS